MIPRGLLLSAGSALPSSLRELVVVVVSSSKMKTRRSRSPRLVGNLVVYIVGDDAGAREIRRRCLMPRLPRSVGNTYCGPQSCRDFHRTDAPVFPGAVTSCARFNLPPTSALPYSSSLLLLLVVGNHHHHHRHHHYHHCYHPSEVSLPLLTRVSFAARFDLPPSALPPPTTTIRRLKSAR